MLMRNWLWLCVAMTPVLLALSLVWPQTPLFVLLVYLLSPAYMLHQLEEHWRDRFRRFINDRVFGGREALTPAAVFVINVPLVWGVNLGAWICAATGRSELALVAVYLMLVNALVHSLSALRFGYNPGLATSLFVFFPLGGTAAAIAPAPPAAHLAAMGVALGMHALLVGYALHRVRWLKAAQP